MKDTQQLNDIINNISKYDKLQFLHRVSTLRLFYENRDKAFLIDSIITEMLNWLAHNDWEYTGIQMSYGKFKAVIVEVNQLDLKMGVDPLDNPYYSRILFFGNYFIMPGINSASSYNLQKVIETLFLDDKYILKDKFKKEYFEIIKSNLEISDKVIKSIMDCEMKERESEFKRELFLPSKKLLDQYMTYIYLEHADPPSKQLLLSTDKYEINSPQIFNTTQPEFLTAPYLNTPKGILILDITSIAFALVQLIISAEEDEFNEVLFNNVWTDVERSLRTLNHKKVQQNKVELKEESNYKEGIYSIANDKLLICIGLFPNLSFKNDFSKKIEDRLNYIFSNLKVSGIENQDIYLLLIAHSFGEEDGIRFSSKWPFTFLNAMELNAISINETDNFFLPRYMKAKENLTNNFLSNIYGDFNMILYFSQNDMSFYSTDDMDYRDFPIYFAFEETSNYYYKLSKKEDAKLFISLFDGHYHEAISEKEKIIYYTQAKDNLGAFIETASNKYIEVRSEKYSNQERLNILLNVFDLLTYWLERYFTKHSVDENVIIYLMLSEDNLEDYSSIQFDNIGQPRLDIEKKPSLLIWKVKVSDYQSLGRAENNKLEKNLIMEVINFIKEEVNIDFINSLFMPSFKKKMTSFLVTNHSISRLPLSIDFKLDISDYEVNNLLEEIGDYFKRLGYQYGDFNKEDNSKICNLIVGYLYEVLSKEIANYSKTQLINILYHQLEYLLPNQLKSNMEYHNEVALNATEEDKLIQQMNINNKKALSLKFLLEYVAASKINGQKNVSQWNLERHMVICSLILEWAHRSDYFKYKLINSRLSLLASNRIGVRQEDYEEVNNALETSLQVLLTISEEEIVTDPRYIERLNEILNRSLDKAFLSEFKYTNTEFNSVIDSLIVVSNDYELEVVKENKYSLVDKIYENLSRKLEKESIWRVIQSITLKEREDFLKPNDGFHKNDVLPWRFNRSLSFIRRPIILYRDNFIYGKRNVAHLRNYIYRLIQDGSYKAESKEMKDLVSRIANIQGSEFNDRVKHKLSSYFDLTVDIGLEKFNGHKITDKNKNTLGDIDVLAINKKSKRIFIIETKDFKVSRNPYEIAMEYKKLFEGDKSFLKKHLRRVAWIEDNLDIVLDYYKCQRDKWKVIPMFIVSEHLITRDLVDTNGVQFLSFKELSASNFK